MHLAFILISKHLNLLKENLKWGISAVLLCQIWKLKNGISRILAISKNDESSQTILINCGNEASFSELMVPNDNHAFEKIQGSVRTLRNEFDRGGVRRQKKSVLSTSYVCREGKNKTVVLKKGPQDQKTTDIRLWKTRMECPGEVMKHHKLDFWTQDAAPATRPQIKLKVGHNFFHIITI